MNLATLYKRTKTGAIQYYQVTVQDVDSELRPRAVIRKESGQLGTISPVTHEETIAEGKNLGKSNETTYYEQAQLQATSDHKRKKDEGYKSLEDILGIQGAYTDEQETPGLLERLLQTNLPQFNTDAQGNVKPMLAMDWKKVKTIPYPVYIQPKLDGVRCLMIVSNDDVRFLSRSGKDYTTLNHVGEDVQKYIYNTQDQSFILDGEIYSDELTFQEITQAVKKQYPNSLKLHFRAYDIVSEGLQSERLEETLKLVSAIGSPFIHYVPTSVATNEELVKAMHDDWVKQGYEGAMLRLPNGTYGQGQRSRHLLKVKEYDEAEFMITGGKLYKVDMSLTGAMECSQQDADSFTFTCVTSEGKVFDAKPKGSRKQRTDYVLNLSEYIGKQLTVKFFGWTDEQKPRNGIGKAVRDYE